MENKITLKTQSDVLLSDYSLDINKRDSNFTITSAITDNQLKVEITTTKNNDVNQKEVILRAAAKYTKTNGIKSNVKTPFVTITQQSHPKYYIEGNTGVDVTTVPEDGGVVTVTTYAIQEDNPNKIVNSNYFSITINGNASRSISEPVETENGLVWKITVDKNPDTSNKYMLINVNFDDGNDSTWISSPMYITQAAHVQIISNPIFTATPTLIEYTGGDVTITCYYTVDGVTTPLGEISVIESTFSSSDYIMIGSGATRTLRILQNTSAETLNGDPNKSMKLKVSNPKGGDDLVIGPIQQKTKKQGTYVFNFSDGTFEKNIIEAFSYEAQDVTIGIVSTKTDEYDGTVEVPITCSCSNTNMISATPTFNSSILTLPLNENTGEDSRNCVITISQNGTSMPSLKLYISQKCKNPQGVLPSFDYMIITMASDMLAGDDMDIMVYAKDMPSDYQYYKCVGYDAEKYLKNVEFSDTGFEFTDWGDDVNNSLRWGGDNTERGSESVLLTPKKFLTESFITEQLKASKEYFEIDIYGHFYTRKYTGLSTIKMQAYTSENDALVVENPYSSMSSLFKPDSSANLVLNTVCNAWIHTEGETGEGGVKKAQLFKTDYTKIATIKYKYSDGSWRFEQPSNVIVTPIESQKDAYRQEINRKDYWENLSHKGCTKLYSDYIFGSMNDKFENTKYDFYTLGAAGYAYINESERVQHTFNQFAFYYDQTEYQITKLAITDGSQPTNDDWKESGNEVYNNSDFEWYVTKTPSTDDKLWLYLEEVGANETSETTKIERQTYQTADTGASIPFASLTGTLYDPVSKKTSTFTIEESTGSTFRKISWNDTANGDISASRYVELKSLTYDKNLYNLIGVASYNSTPTSSTYLLLDGYKYYYNSNAKNLIFKWGNLRSITDKVLKIYASGYSGCDMLTEISYGFSNSRTVEPTFWSSPKQFVGPIKSSMEYLGDISINNTTNQNYLWISLCSDESRLSGTHYGPYKINCLFKSSFTCVIFKTSNNSCEFGTTDPI